MKKIFLLISALVLTTVSASAAPSTCQNGTYADYLLLTEGCTVGDLLFSGFGFLPGGTAPLITANQVGVGVITDLGMEGFAFNPGINLSNVGSPTTFLSRDAALSFTVTALVGMLTDLHLFSNGVTSGSGAVNVTETYCFNG
ncbi:MAG: hypothetical protein ABI823_05035, partial [Bryobacteraceae bacterium]